MEQHLQEAAPPPPPQFPDVQPSPAANPTPTSHSSSHPSYAEMITAAILWDSSQGKAGGSSKRAIAKYIDRVYTNLPPTHSALLTHHLKRLKNSGHLVMIKNSYQLPVVAANNANVNANAGVGVGAAVTTTPAAVGSASAAVPIRSAPPSQQPQFYGQFEQPVDSSGGAAAVATTPKRRPGRPPKVKPEARPTEGNASVSVNVSGNGNGNGNGPSSGKRPRGRPPRQQPAVSEVPFVQTVSQPQVQAVNNGQQSSGKRRPGRPAKRQQFAETGQPVYEANFQPSGKDMVVAVTPLNGTVSKRRPGRPPKGSVGVGRAGPSVSGSKPRGRPKRSALAPALRPYGKRPRGRPPRNPVLVGAIAGGKGRGRGRPPKGSGGTPKQLKPRKYSGKPPGRPRKNAKQTPVQGFVDEMLTKKVENMQATIRDAVSVIKPYLVNENAADALAAMQQLEDLSMMNINASATEPPITAMSVDENVQVQLVTSVPEPAQETVSAPTVDPPVAPFSVSASTITENAPPLYAPPSTIGIQHPPGWIPSSEAQL